MVGVWWTGGLVGSLDARVGRLIVAIIFIRSDLRCKVVVVGGVREKKRKYKKLYCCSTNQHHPQMKQNKNYDVVILAKNF